MSTRIYSTYGWTTFTPEKFQSTVKKLARLIRRIRDRQGCDAIVVSGSSGSAFGYPVSFLTGIPVVYIRKANERSHGQVIEAMRAEGAMKSYVILDDFVDTGETIRYMYSQIVEHATVRYRIPMELQAVILYDDESRCQTFELKIGTTVPIKRV